MSGDRCDIILRRAVLMQLEAASPASLPVETVMLGLSAAGLCVGERDLLKALDYLAQKNMLELVRSSISAAHVRAKLTAAGRDFLESGDF